MKDSEIKDKVVQALVGEFELEVDELIPEARFKEDLGLDSLDAVDMIVALEKQFGIKIGKDPAVVQIKTLDQLYSYLIDKLKD